METTRARSPMLAVALACAVTAALAACKSTPPPHIAKSPNTVEPGHHTAETVQKANDDADLNSAIRAYRFFYWQVSMAGLFRGFESYGPIENKTFFVREGNPSQEFSTPNSDAPYAALPLDLHGGPITLELPPGPLTGIVNDHNFRWVMDVGLPGPDAGRGGRHLILPPDYKGKIPSGYYVGASTTFRVFLIIRSRPLGGDMRGALARIKTVKIRPLNRPHDWTPNKWIKVTERSFDATSRAWETNINFWEELHRIVDTELPDAQFPNNYGELASLGIVKGKPFAPDARMKGILEEAAKLANARMNRRSKQDDDQDDDEDSPVVHYAGLRDDTPPLARIRGWRAHQKDCNSGCQFGQQKLDLEPGVPTQGTAKTKQ